MGIGDWGLGIGDWGMRIEPNPQYPKPKPQSPNTINKLIFFNNLFYIKNLLLIIYYKNYEINKIIISEFKNVSIF